MYDSMRKFTAVIEKEDDAFVAKCIEIGTVSQGKTIEESLDNLKQATELYLEEFPDKEIKDPIIKEFKVADSVKA